MLTKHREFLFSRIFRVHGDEHITHTEQFFSIFYDSQRLITPSET